jgi:hypothetical protein
VLPTNVVRFPEGVRIPQQGWNKVTADPRCKILRSGFAYFSNSFCMRSTPAGWHSTGMAFLHTCLPYSFSRNQPRHSVCFRCGAGTCGWGTVPPRTFRYSWFRNIKGMFDLLIAVVQHFPHSGGLLRVTRKAPCLHSSLHYVAE